MVGIHIPNINKCIMKPLGKKLSRNLVLLKYNHLCNQAERYQYNNELRHSKHVQLSTTYDVSKHMRFVT